MWSGPQEVLSLEHSEHTKNCPILCVIVCSRCSKMLHANATWGEHYHGTTCKSTMPCFISTSNHVNQAWQSKVIVIYMFKIFWSNFVQHLINFGWFKICCKGWYESGIDVTISSGLCQKSWNATDVTCFVLFCKKIGVFITRHWWSVCGKRMQIPMWFLCGS